MAGALAAVTSFLLSAKIGIAGSVIGVAVGSIVSAVASQIYQNLLRESGRKLQAAAPFDGGDDNKDSTVEATEPGTGEIHGGSPNRTITMQGLGDAVDGTASLAELARNGAGKPQDPVATTIYKNADLSNGDNTSDSSTSIMPSVMQGAKAIGSDTTKEMRRDGNGSRSIKGQAGNRAVRDMNDPKRAKRTMVIISIVSALVAVAITAGVITLVTHGNGTDDVVRNVVNNSQTGGGRQQKLNTDTDAPSQPGNSGNRYGNGGNTNSGNGLNDSGKVPAPTSGESGSGSSGTGTSGESGSGSTPNSGSTSGTTGESAGSDNNGNSTGNGSGSTSGNDGTADSSGTGSGSNGSDAPSNGSTPQNSGTVGTGSTKVNK